MFLPLLPTTPFLLVTAYCFSKSSTRLHGWLLSRPYLGPKIHDWEQHGMIRTPAKWSATGVMITLFGFTLFFVRVSVWIKAVVSAIGLSALLFIWTRPSHPRSPSASSEN